MALLRRRRTDTADLGPFPPGWDPYFGFMSLADVYRYPARHFEHHRRQLTLNAAASKRPDRVTPPPARGQRRTG